MTTLTALPEKTTHKKTYTLWEYLAREARVKEKHEFYDGMIRKTPNTKFSRNLIVTNIAFVLGNALKQANRKCVVLGSKQKVYIASENVAVYPDALVIFEKPIFFENRQDMLVNPLVVVEVLSRSTGLYDRTMKFDLYQAIPSFKEYILIDSKKIKIETRFREAEDLWRMTTYTTENQHIALKFLGIELEINDIYEKC
jgi:Uma2 family endonuclease